MSKISEVSEKLKEYVAIVHNKFEKKKPTTIRSDNGDKYTNSEIEEYIRENGIEHQLTVPHCPSQNDVAKT